MIININQPWPYLATAVFIALIGVYAKRQTRRPGSSYFLRMVALWLVWALAAGLATVVQSRELRYLLWVLQPVCAFLIIPLHLMFALEYTGHEKWLSRRRSFLLTFPAIILTYLLLTQPGSFRVIAENHFGFEVYRSDELARWGIVYASVFMAFILGVLFMCLLRSPAYRAPIVLIILGEIIPLVGYVMVYPQRLTVSTIQVSILFTNFAALAFSLALFNYHILQVVPVARDLVVFHMPYVLIVLDAENRLVDFNTASQSLPDLPGKLVLRQPVARALGDWWRRLSPLIGPFPHTQEVILHTGDCRQYFVVYSIPLLQASGWRMGQVFVLQDVTQERQEQRQQAQFLWAQASLQEREQLADELHDGLSQGLAFLNLQAQAAQVYLQSGQEAAAQASLARLTEAAEEIQEDTRQLIGDLLSVSLPADNFCASLRQVLARFEQQTGLTVRLEMDGDPPSSAEMVLVPSRLPPTVAVQLIRITQEALANVRKHAQDAGQVNVDLKTGDGRVSLTISDDGKGFDPDAQPSGGKHFGLQVMQQRAARIGGQVAVFSAPGLGTRVEVWMPLASDETRNMG